MPYQSGLSRGDTPPKDIPTIGASPRRFFPERYGTTRWMNHRDDNAPFAQRHHTMFLDTVQPEDTLRGCPKNYKDWDPSLTTYDIFRAQPAIAHPCTNGHHTKDFKDYDKPPMPEIERNMAATHYPRIQTTRPRDLTTTTFDIEGALPKTKGLKTPRVVDPLCPLYTFAASEAKPSTAPRHSGRDQLAVDDIPKARPQKSIPSRNEYRDTMMIEDEFRAQKKNAHELSMSLTATDIMGHVPPRDTGPKKSFRASDPLNPVYTVPLTHNPPGTSLHATWDEERKANTGCKSTKAATIGDIHGSKPKTRARDNGEPTLSLVREDLPTACPMRRIGSLPYSIYGPPGNRRFSASLDTQDINGAQADTLPRGPRMPQRTAQDGQNTSMGSPRAMPACLDISDVPGAKAGSVAPNLRAYEQSKQWPPSPAAAAPSSPAGSSARGRPPRGSA